MPGVRIDNWKGLATAISPYVLAPGAAVRQSNLQIKRPGELRQRPGMEPVYSAVDYSQVLGMYRVSNGVNAADDLILCAKLNSTQTFIRYQTPTDPTSEYSWSAAPSTTVSTSSMVSPTFAEDRFGRIFVFQGDGVTPLVINRQSKIAQVAGMQAPQAAPSVTPSGNGYFIERVDVVSGGGSYWAAPPIVIQGGGARVRDARLKAIVQGGSIVAVDVIDGGSGYQTPPTLAVDESTVKGVGFRGYGVIGVDPGIQGFEPVFQTTGTLNGTNQISNVTDASLFRVGARVSGTNIPASAVVQAVVGSTVTLNIPATGSGSVTLTVNEGALTAGHDAAKPNCFSTSTSSPSVAYGFAGNGTLTGNVLTGIESVVLNRLQVGAVVEATRSINTVTTSLLPAGTTIQAVDVSTGIVTLTNATSYSAGSASLVFTQPASATYDAAADRYTALIPLTGTTNTGTGAATAGVGAAARVQFSQYTVTLANRITSTTAPDSTWPVRYTVAGTSPAVQTFFGTSTSTLGVTADYYYNTDDMTVGPNGATTASAYWPYWFPKQNEDYFAALTPGLTYKFHSRVPISFQWISSSNNGAVQNYDYTYGDAYLLDFGSISVRYYTGSREELESATDVESKWVWVTVPVQVNANGRPFIDVELQPAKKAGTTAYAQYAGYTKPVVRFYLTYCPDSWVSTIGDNQYNVGWRRTNTANTPQNRAQNANTNSHKGWWCAGAATTGASSRPIVDFATGPASNAAAGINYQTCEVLTSGAGMEQGTFFAVQFDQVNAAAPWWGYTAYNTRSQYNNIGTITSPSAGNPASAQANYAGIDKNPVSPAWNDEYNWVQNPARLTKSFSQYRVRFYFWANSVSPGQLGPPGAVAGTPSVEVVGSGYKTNDRANFWLQQRSDLTATATYTTGDRYVFTARKITDPSTTNTIASVAVSSGGTNYYGSPKLKYTGTGFGLTMDAVVSNGQITAVNVQSGGGGFTSQPLVYADAETATLIPVMRPAMRGTYRCAYRYADWSLTQVAEISITTQAGSTSATVSDGTLLDLDFVIESSNTKFMSRIASKAGNSVTLSQAATATGTVTAIVRDMSKPIAYSNFSPIVDVDTTTFPAVPNPTAMVWSLPNIQPPSRATVVEFFRTSGDESLVFYRLEQYGKVTGSTVEIVGSDTMTDEDLFNPTRPFYAALPVVLPNGGLNAYRFGVPRSDMHVCAAYGDRMWYAVSTSGEQPNSVFFSVYDEFESCPPEYEISIQNNQKSTDSLTGLVPFGTYLLCMQNAHCYGLSYNTAPDVDASIQLLAHRGMLSQGCHDLFDDNLYVMDERGVYVMDRSGNVQSLSDQIRNWFDNGLLDLTHRRKFFVKVDQRNSVLRAFVVTKGSGATTPNMAFCYHVDLKVWWTESWPNGLTCAVDFRRAFLEPDQPIYGAVDGDIYRAGGLSDYSYRALRSVTVTNGGSGYASPPTVSVAAGQPGSGAQFTPVLSGGKVVEVLIDEPGFGYGTLAGDVLTQTVPLTISPPSSGVTATATAQCDPLTTAPFQYPEFSVYYAVKTGAMELVNDGNANTKDAMQDRSISVLYRPTETNSDLYLREFFNNSAQPRSNVMPRDRGTGFVHDTAGAKTRLNMSATRSALGAATGVAKAMFAGRNYSDMGGADRHVAVELSGPSVPVTPTSPPPSEALLYGLEINGVLGGGN